MAADGPVVRTPAAGRDARGIPFAGASEMARRMNELDWSQTAVGPVATWPQRLRTVVDICLASRFPIVSWWGRDEMTMFYNDAYIPMLGPTKHPQWLGRRGSECWSDIWDIIGPMIVSVFEHGEATWSENLLLVMDRNLPREETYFTFSYSPIPIADGSVGGVFCAVQETTERVIAERRLATLRDLGARVDARSDTDACELAAETLGQNLHDVPFSLIYLIDAERSHAHLAALSGLPADHRAAPDTVELRPDAAGTATWPFALAARAHAPVAFDLPPKLGNLPGGPWPESPERALILPLVSPSTTEVTGFLVAGVGPRRPLDDAYRDFFNLVAGHVATALANARAYEEERERAEALAEIDRAKTAFFSNVSHEFRTPLTLLLGPLADAIAAVDAPDPEDQRERLQVAQSNALRLQRLVNTLLDFSRIEAGRADASYEPTRLATYTAELASMFRAAFDRAGIELRIDTEPLDEPVYVDRQMWEKVVMNLLSNAFKFTFEGRVTVGVRAVGRHAELTVRDTGVGIAPDELPRLFERFHRVPGVRSRTHEGTGIGLSLVQELVRLHGGDVRAESTPGAGSMFIVTVPLGSAHLPQDRIAAARALDSTASAPAAFLDEVMRWLPDEADDGYRGIEGESADINVGAPHATAGARVLIADDNADMRDYLRRILEEHWRVQTVADGERALAAIRADAPDLVLSDVMMPGLDGFHLIEALRADPATAALPVVILSARAGEEARVEGLDHGADDYLVKPFSARELVARVGTRLEIAQMARQSEAALRRQRENLYNIIMQAPVAMYTLRGEDLTFEVVNRPALDLLGVDSAAGKPLADVLPDIAAQGYVDRIEGVMRTGEPYVGHDVPLRVSRGGQPADAYVTFVCAPLRNADGVIDGVVGVTTVVTEEVRARQRIEEINAQLRDAIAELRHQRSDTERFTALVETSSDYVGVAHSDGTVFYLNAAARRLMGLAADAPLPPAIGQYLSPDSWRHVRDIALPAARENGEWRGEIVLRHFATGELIEMDQTIFLMTDSAGETNIATVGRDIRERKAMEDELRRLNTAKDDFLSMVSHELRTPITTILGNAQVLRLRVEHLDDAARASALWDIESEAVRLNRIIANLLLLARLDRGEHPNTEPLFAERQIARMVGDYRKQHPQREVRVVGDNGAPVLAEPGYFEQILLNLLTNADKYSPINEAIDVTVTRGTDDATISVRDRGVGVAPEDAEAVFTPFYHSVRTADQVQGMGIGLAVCKRLVEAQAGRIWMTPLPEGGTEVSFTLPLECDDWSAE